VGAEVPEEVQVDMVEVLILNQFSLETMVEMGATTVAVPPV
jgi:hypothetical protein